MQTGCAERAASLEQLYKALLGLPRANLARLIEHSIGELGGSGLYRAYREYIGLGIRVWGFGFADISRNNRESQGKLNNGMETAVPILHIIPPVSRG